MLLKMAWRNIWRQKRRTLITVISLTLGVTGIVFMHSYMRGVWDEVVVIMTRTMLGNFQIHGDGYQDEPAIHNTVPDPMAVEAALKQRIPNAQPLQRVFGFGLVAVEEISTATMIVGLQPDRERATSELLAILPGGRDLAASAAKEVVVGRDLATQLEVEVGGELILLGEAADGSLANDLYNVVGIGDAGSAEMNGGAVFLHLADAQEFFALGKGVHQIMVNIPGQGEDVSEPVGLMRDALDLETLEVLGWAEIAPEVEGVVRSKRQGAHWIDILVFVIVGLGILNAMAMSAFERTREFGVMASLGTTRRRILGLVLAESLIQCAIGLALGTGLAVLLLYGIGTINFGELVDPNAFGNLRLPPIVVLELKREAVVVAVVTVISTALAGGLWPAWKASRLSPTEAVRQT